MAASAAETGVFEHFWRGSAVIGPLARASGTRKYRAIGQDVSGMAPPSRMMRAQRSRIAANMSNMAALIFKNIRRPWRTILPAV